MGLVRDCLIKYYEGHLTSEYLRDLPQNIRTSLQQAEARFQNGDLSSIKDLAQKVLSVLEGPARSSERLETAEGDTEDGQNLHPEMIPDLNTSQVELSSDLTTDPTVLAIPDSGICEIPEIQEPVAISPRCYLKKEKKTLDYTHPGAVPLLVRAEQSTPAPEPWLKIRRGRHGKKMGGDAADRRRPSDQTSSGTAPGSVYLARHKDLHHTFAMKKMAKWSLHIPEKKELAYLERDILTFSDCPFVVSMLCSFPSKSHLCMVMEYAEGGDCQTLLHTRGRLSVPLARLYFAEAVVAVEYLHSYGVVHRDLKPENLLITSTGHIKVTDFGLSKLGVMMPKNNIYKQSAEEISREFKDLEVSGTPYYVAPEVILKQGYGRPVDWWAMGIILHQFLVGSVPFRGKSPDEVFKNIVGAGAFEIKSHPFLTCLDFDNLLSQKPEYIPQLVSSVDTSFSIKHSDINKHLVSEDEDESFIYQNFSSSSEWLSKRCAPLRRRRNARRTKKSAQTHAKTLRFATRASFFDENRTHKKCNLLHFLASDASVGNDARVGKRNKKTHASPMLNIGARRRSSPLRRRRNSDAH
ncbi:unnamed protein product [Ranitomeya imitator]|uniref:non-specific serine/threonine protein kinase n=1 Tax=Ranitomeya imitator TaxID=111125 RepID=A0ABN9ML32_9NEOB|nr:unnamed protein product [Ranitomeya imitator]